MIGIIAAMESEAREIKAVMEDRIKIHYGGMDFIKGKLFNKEMIVVQCGIGKVNAAMCTQILIDLFKVKMVMNVGVAGAVHSELGVGDIVISKDCCQYDMDARAFGHPLGEIPNMNITFFKAEEELIQLAENAAKELDVSYQIGRVMTADLGVDSSELKEQLFKEFGGLCVEMEGAAIGHVAHQNQVPFLIIRSISDNADGNLSEDYKMNLEKSIKKGVEIVFNMIEGLK